MPTPFATALIAVGAVTTSVSAVVGTTIAGLGGLLQFVSFVLDGMRADDGGR